MGLPTSKTSYLHFDEDYSLIKTIIYLKPVTTNSPFKIISKQKLKEMSYSREAFFKRLDDCAIPLSKSLFQMANNYYRPVFKLPDYRKEFMKLPAGLRGTSHFGDDVLDGSPLSDWILKNENTITSDKGNCVVFTGGQCLHRGGMVESGERWVLQVGFRQRDYSIHGYKERLKNALKMNLPLNMLNMIRDLKPGGQSRVG